MMKHKVNAGIICACLLLLITGCGAGTESGTGQESLPGSALADDLTQRESADETFHDDLHDDLEENTGELSGEPADERNSDEESGAGPAEIPAEESGTEPVEMPDGEPEAETAGMTAEEPVVENEFYQKLISAVRKCIAGEEVEMPEEYDFSVSIHMFPGDTLGYFIEDIDGDGTEELVIGDTWGEDHTLIYNIYTMSGGELVRAADGWERNQYYLCENGMIANEGSSGAANSSYAYFTFDGTELHLIESIIYDGFKDPENPWFYSTESVYDAEYAEPVSEEQAREIMSRYVYKKLTFIPFVPQD